MVLVKKFAEHRGKHPFPSVNQPLEFGGDLNKILVGENVWYKEFILGNGAGGQPALTTAEIFNLLHAGSALDYENLMDLAAMALASKYKAYTSTQLEAIFLDGKPVPKEEEEAILKDHKWIENEPMLFEVRRFFSYPYPALPLSHNLPFPRINHRAFIRSPPSRNILHSPAPRPCTASHKGGCAPPRFRSGSSSGAIGLKCIIWTEGDSSHTLFSPLIMVIGSC